MDMILQDTLSMGFLSKCEPDLRNHEKAQSVS
jgi:hypothetical protein